MLDRKSQKLSKYLPFTAMIAGLVSGNLLAGQAQALTAAEVLDNMNTDQWFGYVSGVVDGLATARWVADQPDATGMQCIYDWYTARPADQTIADIEQWFERHRDQQAGILMHVLIGKECPNT